MRCAWVLLAASTMFGGVAELGHPLVREFPPGKNKLGYVVQAVGQDSAGFIYIANDACVRYYDGTVWKEILTTDESGGPRRFARTAGGTLYVGGQSMIGYFQRGGNAPEFVSLANRLPSTALGCEEIEDVAAVGETVYFADAEKILRWSGGMFRVIPGVGRGKERGVRLHVVDETVYLTAPGCPLRRVAGDHLEAVLDHAAVREHRVVLLEREPGGALRLLNAQAEWWRVHGGQAERHPAADMDTRMRGQTLWRALRMKDGSLAAIFTGRTGGGRLFGPDGADVGPLDESLGLYTQRFHDLFEDREGGLWVGTEVGMFRVEWPSGVSVFDAVNGLGAGRVNAIVRHTGVLYVATEEGVFRLCAAAAGHGARFEQVCAQPVAALWSDESGLLALAYDELMRLTERGFVPVAKTPSGATVLVTRAGDRDRLWLASTETVRMLRRTGEGWEESGTPLNFAEPARSVRRTAEGGLWFARSDVAGFPVTFDRDRAVAGAVVQVGDTAVAVEARADAAPGARWLARANEIVRLCAGREEAVTPLVQRSTGVVRCLQEESGLDGPVLWVGGERGLFRVEVRRAFPAPVPFATVLTTEGLRSGQELPAEHEPVRFDYVALRLQLEDSVVYQTRLAGFESRWSAWTSERTRAFTRLPAGSYRFEVRARDAAGALAAPALESFTVLPVWWRTRWAFLGYLATGAGLVTGLVRYRTRALRQRTERLETLVRARTAELADRNRELTRLHQLELDEKISARLAEEKARLEVLRYQLNPHFLFNTLASISACLPAGNSAARGMVDRLAEFCRLTLHGNEDRDWTTLGDEIQLLRTYMEIEKARWGELLDLEFDCDGSLDSERLPHFLLLPVVENALKYGRATSPDRVGLRIASSRDESGAVVLLVANTGQWIVGPTRMGVSSLGIGLENLRERLARYFPAAHDLKIEASGGWVTVTLRIKAASGRPLS